MQISVNNRRADTRPPTVGGVFASLLSHYCRWGYSLQERIPSWQRLVADALASHKSKIVGIDIDADIDGRRLIAQQVVLRYAGSRREPSVVRALASCAVD